MTKSFRDLIQESLDRQEAKRQSEPANTLKSPVNAKQPLSSQRVSNERKLRPIMSQEQIAEVIQTIEPGNLVEIQFNGQDIFDVNYLRGMHIYGILTVDVSNEMVMLAVATSRSWDHPMDRVFRFKANINWDKNWFSGRLARRLEAITIIN